MNPNVKATASYIPGTTAWTMAIFEAVDVPEGTQVQPVQQPELTADWKLVPVEPTKAMYEAARRVPESVQPYPPHFSLIWDAMLAATPIPAPTVSVRPTPIDKQSEFSRTILHTIYLACQRGDSPERLHAAVMAEFDKQPDSDTAQRPTSKAEEKLRLSEEALLKNGFKKLDDIWVAPTSVTHSGCYAALLEYYLASVEFNNSHGDGPEGESLSEAVERSRKAEERFEAATQAAHKAIAAYPLTKQNKE